MAEYTTSSELTYGWTALESTGLRYSSTLISQCEIVVGSYAAKSWDWRASIGIPQDFKNTQITYKHSYPEFVSSTALSYGASLVEHTDIAITARADIGFLSSEISYSHRQEADFSYTGIAYDHNERYTLTTSTQLAYVHLSSDAEAYSQPEAVVELSYTDASGLLVYTDVNMLNVDIRNTYPDPFIDFSIALGSADDAAYFMHGAKGRIAFEDGTVFNFIAEDLTRTKSFAARVFRISGRSPTCLLSAPFAAEIEFIQDTDTTAYDLITRILSFVDASDRPVVEYQDFPNWIIYADRFAANGTTPITAIQTVVQAAGGFLQSSPDGKLIVRHAYPITWPALEEATTGDQVFTEMDDILVESESTAWNLHRNEVQIVDSEASETYNVTLEHITDSVLARSYGADTAELRVYEVPFSGSLDVKNASIEIINVHEETIITEAVDNEQLVVLAGSGKTAKPIYALRDTAWQRTDLGDVDFTEDGTLSSEINGHSLLKVSYDTKYYRLIVSTSCLEDVLFFIEDWRYR